MNRQIALGIVLLQCLTLQTSWAQSTPVYKPTGVYASAGWRNRDALASDLAKGILVRVPWKQIEPEPGRFDFSTIDMQRRAITQANKQWSLAVLAGPNAPIWLTDKLYDAATMRIKVRTREQGYVPMDMPCFWDKTVQDRLRQLADALAEKYNTDPSLVLVYVPQMTSNGIEGHFNANLNDDLVKAGLTGEKFIDAAQAAAQSFAKAFAHKAIAIEVHEILGDATIPSRIINGLWNDPTLEHRVGAAMWWISGKDNYQPNLLKVFMEFPGDIYAQVIGRSDQSYRFPDGDYTRVFTQARELGIRYVEVWEYELKQKNLFDAIRQFNADTESMK